MSVDEMEAGPEIDTLVAERFMGWPHIDDDEPFRFHVSKGGVITSSGPAKFHRSDVLQGIPQRWRPSTDINAAWDVVEKMREMSCDLTIESAGAVWHATFGGGAFAGSGNTAPLAICRAVLKVNRPAGGSIA